MGGGRARPERGGRGHVPPTAPNPQPQRSGERERGEEGPAPGEGAGALSRPRPQAPGHNGARPALHGGSSLEFTTP